MCLGETRGFGMWSRGFGTGKGVKEVGGGRGEGGGGSPVNFEAGIRECLEVEIDCEGPQRGFGIGDDPRDRHSPSLQAG